MSGTAYPGVATGTVPCPHCGAANPAGGQFCQSCGKALPAVQPSGPRIVSGATLASTSAGQKLQGDELVKTAKKASGALLAAAVLCTLGAAFVYYLANYLARGRIQLPMYMVAMQCVIAVVFWGLWVWSLRQPLPAAIVGLILYGTLVVINVVTNVSNMSAHGGTGSGIGGLGVGWIDVIILASLGQGIAAASKHRKLLAQQQDQQGF